MIPKWKRLVCSLLCVMIAAIAISLASVLWDHFGRHGKLDIGGFLFSFCFVLLFSAPGWFLAIPAVILVKKVFGWHFWLWLGIGTCIGPIVMWGLDLYWFFSNPNAVFPSPWGPWINLSAGVACLTTLLYLTWLRRALRASGMMQVSVLEA